MNSTKQGSIKRATTCSIGERTKIRPLLYILLIRLSPFRERGKKTVHMERGAVITTSYSKRTQDAAEISRYMPSPPPWINKFRLDACSRGEEKARKESALSAKGFGIGFSVGGG